MNASCYKIVFSKRLGMLVAVGEHTSSTGKAASGQGCRSSVVTDGFVGALRFTFASVALACLSLGNTQAQSSPIASTTLPQGGSVSTGSATISTQGAAMAITQATNKASINWQSFNIGTGASVNIAQPSSDAVLLNRVVGNDPSQILGKLSANGQVILLNPNGVLFGKDGSVTASAFTASTFGLSDADFMAGYYKYNRNGSTAAVVNQGTIETSAGGFVALIGATVTNEGTIRAPQGDVVMAAAESVTLPEELVKPQPVTTPNTVSVRMSKRVRLELDPAAINTAVNNTESGVIVTEGGQVLLQAAAISSAVASVTHSGRIDTSAPQAGAVTVLADNGDIKVNGSITANSSNTVDKGGDIIIGRDIDTGVLAKTADVSGAALESQGGFIETSGEYLNSSGVKVKATEWLLDPNNIEINLTNMAVTAGNSVVLAGDIANALTAGTTVTIATGTGAGSTSSAVGVSQATAGTGNTSAGTIAVNSAITSNYTGATNPVLTLSAASDITVGAAITANGSDIVLKSTGGAISNTAAISGRNVSIDNTGGTINAATGAIVKGGSAGTTGADGITVGANIMASGNLNMYGLSTSDVGIRIASGKTLTGGNIQAVGETGSVFGLSVGTGASIVTTATSGSNLITAIGRSSGGGGSGALALANATLRAASGSTLELKGQAVGLAPGAPGNTRGMRIDGVVDTYGAITLTGESGSTEGVLLQAGNINVREGSLTIKGTMTANGGGWRNGVTLSQPIYLYNNTSLIVEGKAANRSATMDAGKAEKGVNISAVIQSAAGQTGGDVTIIGYTSSVQNSMGADIGGNISTGGNVKIIGQTLGNSTGNSVNLNSVITSASGNVTVQSIGGKINQVAARTISAKNITIDNTGAGLSSLIADTTSGLNLSVGAAMGGSINNATGAITAGSGSASTGTGVALSANLTATGNINIQGAQASAGTGVNIANTSTLTSSGVGASISASSNYNVVHSGSITNQASGGVAATISLSSSLGSVSGAGSLASNGVSTSSGGITIDTATAGTLSGVISGSGSLTKIGAGTTTLSNYQTYSGATNINAGTLSFTTPLTSYATATTISNQYRSTQFNTAAGATLNFNVPTNATVNNGESSTTTFNGAGTLSKTGGGKIQWLIWDNTFNLSAGSLIDIQEGTFLASSTYHGKFTNNRSSLNIAAGATFDASEADVRVDALTGAGSLKMGWSHLGGITTGVNNMTAGTYNTAGSATFSGVISANAGVSTGSKFATIGTGTQILTGANTYVGTTTIGAGSTLQIGNGGATGQLGSGAVANNSTLVFNRDASGDLTVTNAISGTGHLTQEGLGKTILTGTNTYTGTTSISAGILQVGNGGATGTLGSGGVVNNTALIFNRNASADLSVAGAISGSGTLTQAGAGKTILTSDNTYTGATTISAGTLQIGDGGATGTLGSGAVVNNAALIINRDASTDTTIAGDISGTGTFTQAGLGKTILTGTNTYSGTTTISSGTLQVGNGGATGTLGSGAVVDNAALIINRDTSTDTTIAGDISGTGTLTQAGLGKTILTGTNTYSGTTTISTGTLQVGNGGATGTLGSGAVVDNAALIINRDASTDTTIASAISGSGTLTQAGLGKTILTANNSYSGTTTISAGTLQIGNDTTTGTLGTGAVTNNALLDFKRSANTNVTNTITGSGDMQATLSAGGLRLLGNVTLGGDVNLTAEHATDWIGVQFLSNVSAGGDINISGGSSTRHGVQVDAFKTLKTTSLGAQSVTITGSTSGASAAGIAVIGEIQTNSGSTLLATGTATNGGNGIYSELTTGGTNYGKIGSATSGDITLIGISSGGTAPTSINSDAALNRGHGILLRGGITTQGQISLTGEADNGVGVFLQHSTYDYGRTMAEVQPTLQVLSGGVNMAGQDAIFISGTNFGSNAFNNNGVLIGSTLINNSNRGATTITSPEGGIALVTSTTGTSTGSGSITNAATAGAISVTAGDGTATSSASIGDLPASIGTGNNVSRAWTLSPAGTQITQNSNAGVTITSDGTGNVTPSKIINNGTGDVVIGAGTQLNAGDGTGGQVLTVSGNTISQNNFGKTYVYTGAAASTGALSNLSSSFNTLYFTGTAPSAFNSAFNTAFGSTIASGQNTQVLFRDSAGPSFVLNLPNVTKTYGDADPANLNTALQTAYTNSGGGAYLTQAVNGASGSSNTFAIKASELIADVNITRTAGEAVGNYALNMVGTTMTASITGSTALSIGKRNITLAGITASNKTYDGSNAATITAGTFNNLKAGETLLISGTGSFADANVGNGKTVTANIANLNKTDGLGSWSNYNLTSTGNANSSANITPVALTITVNGSNAFVTQDPNSAFNQGFSYSGFVNGETAASALTAAPARSYIGAANPTVGTYANVYDVANTVSAKNGNYTITVNKGALNVIAADALLLNVASQSSMYGNTTAANADTPAANSVTAQYCLAPSNCNGSNIVNLSLRKDTSAPNQWVVNDSTSSTVQFTTALQNTSYSSGGYLQVGNYDYSLSSNSPVVIGTQNFNTVVSTTGSLAVTPLAVALQNTPISKAYDGTTSLPNTTLSISNLPSGDDLQANFTAGAFQSSAVSTAAPFSLYGVALAGTDSGNYTLQNYANNTYSSTGVITGTSSKPQPIVHPPKPIIPTDKTSGGDESGGDSSSGNPYLLIPSGRPNSADRCTPNTLEDCLCETQEPRPVEGITICYQPKKTASTTPAKGRRG